MSADTATPSEALSLLDLPPLDALTADQRRGAVCVWDAEEAPLTAETVVDLGEREDGAARWFPRACRPHMGEQAYRALMGHAGLCEQCTDDAGGCEVGSGLRRLRREGRR